MKELSLKKIAAVVGGHVKTKFGSIKVNDVVTDSRKKDISGALFVAIKGDRFDGHDFIREAVYKGAACVLSEQKLDTSHPVIKVDSTREALKKLAAYYRGLFDIHVVAITGSVGKTTTKDMIAQVLSTKYKTLKTEGNFNNEIGLPLTVFKLDDSYQAAVFELGMNHFGEIRNLSAIAQPTVCVITNIGVAHIENLHSREGILKAKSEIFESLSENGHIVLNGDDDMLRSISSDCNLIHYFGRGPDNFYSAYNIKNNGLIGVSCNIKYRNRNFKTHIPIPGQHMVDNALAATAVGDILGLDEICIKSGLESVRPPKMRMDILNAPGGITIINDAYNASPDSMKAAIDLLADVGSRKVCILGDMFELGGNSAKYHYEIGVYAAFKDMDLIICIGGHSIEIYNGAKDNKTEKTQCLYYEKQDGLAPELRSFLLEGDTVLVKASRGMAFENIVNQLMENSKSEGSNLYDYE